QGRARAPLDEGDRPLPDRRRPPRRRLAGRRLPHRAARIAQVANRSKPTVPRLSLFLRARRAREGTAIVAVPYCYFRRRVPSPPPPPPRCLPPASFREARST